VSAQVPLIHIFIFDLLVAADFVGRKWVPRCVNPQKGGLWEPYHFTRSGERWQEASLSGTATARRANLESLLPCVWELCQAVTTVLLYPYAPQKR
jgi:hypothetical protein